MSCYLRHVKDILTEAGIEVTPANKKRIDQTIHKVVGVEYKDCPLAWRAVKRILGDEKTRQELVKNLKAALG